MPEFNKARLFIKNVRKCGISMNSWEIDSVGLGSGSEKNIWMAVGLGPGSVTTLSDAGRARTEKVGPIHALHTTPSKEAEVLFAFSFWAFSLPFYVRSASLDRFYTYVKYIPYSMDREQRSQHYSIADYFVACLFVWVR